MNAYVIPSSGPDSGPGDVENLSFLPDLSVAEMGNFVRVPPQLSHEIAQSELRRSMIAVNEDIMPWINTQTAAEHATLTDVPQDVYGEVPVLVTLYKSAVYHMAKAGLLEKTRDTDLTSEGADNSDTADEAATDSYRAARQAIAQLTGRRVANVELI